MEVTIGQACSSHTETRFPCTNLLKKPLVNLEYQERAGIIILKMDFR
jgi:hypothetical protein